MYRCQVYLKQVAKLHHDQNSTGYQKNDNQQRDQAQYFTVQTRSQRYTIRIRPLLHSPLRLIQSVRSPFQQIHGPAGYFDAPDNAYAAEARRRHEVGVGLELGVVSVFQG